MTTVTKRYEIQRKSKIKQFWHSMMGVVECDCLETAKDYIQSFTYANNQSSGWLEVELRIYDHQTNTVIAY